MQVSIFRKLLSQDLKYIILLEYDFITSTQLLTWGTLIYVLETVIPTYEDINWSWIPTYWQAYSFKYHKFNGYPIVNPSLMKSIYSHADIYGASCLWFTVVWLSREFNSISRWKLKEIIIN